MEYCPHCMHPVQGGSCPLCGGDVTWKGTPPQLPVGTILSSKGSGHTYQVGAARGQGGFGITYIGLDMESRKRVAIKEYFPTRCSRRTDGTDSGPKTGMENFYAGGMASFLKEAQMLSSLEPAPSIVRVYDFFEANHTAYLVMEFVDGEPLYKKVRREGRILPQDLLPKIPELIRDLARIHEAGVIHRDISPDNLIWMEDGALKLLDFGCARFMEDGKSMTVLLKHGFAPVEQYQTKGQGTWTDVYGLSATIYYCLTGIIPPSAVERLDNDELKSLTDLGVPIMQKEEEAILWGMAVQPKFRPVNMEVLAERLFPELYNTLQKEEPHTPNLEEQVISGPDSQKEQVAIEESPIPPQNVPEPYFEKLNSGLQTTRLWLPFFLAFGLLIILLFMYFTR